MPASSRKPKKFAVHPNLRRDTVPIGDLRTCRILLMKNSRFPWIVLVPKRNKARELFDLGPKDYSAVMEEVKRVARAFAAHTKADKMNIAALGNVVPQLHIHIIARFKDDPAWPKPIWNAQGPQKQYTSGEQAALVKELKTVLLSESNITKM